MNWKYSPKRYGSLSIGLHWLMFLLIVAVYACIELREFYPKGSEPREALKSWHFMLGLSVLVLVWLRVAVRLTQTPPLITPEPAVWQQLSAKTLHAILYLFMFGMPLAGWLLLSAAGKPIPFYGMTLPPLVAENKSLAKLIKEIHETAGTAGYGLIGLHAAAALFHHYYRRDDTLIRMLPRKLL